MCLRTRGSVNGETHVVIPQNRDVVGQQLQWNDRQDTLQAINSLWHLDALRGIRLHRCIAFVANDDRVPLF